LIISQKKERNSQNEVNTTKSTVLED